MEQLLEKTRSELINKSTHADRTKSYGTTRYDRRNYQHVFNTVQQFNRVDMNAVFRGNMLSFIVPVKGETNNYEVELLFEGIMTAIAQQVKLNQYNFEYKCVYRAIIDAINRNDLFVGCTCPDFHYRMGYWASKGRYNAGRPQIIPSDSTNPHDTKGAGCKHVMAVIANLDWAMKLATTITNYVFYMEEHMPDLYYKWMFPAIYGMSYEEAVSRGIIEPNDNEDDLANSMDNDDDIADIDAANNEYEDGEEVDDYGI